MVSLPALVFFFPPGNRDVCSVLLVWCTCQDCLVQFMVLVFFRRVSLLTLFVLSGGQRTFGLLAKRAKR